MKYALNLGADGRVLSATYPKYAPDDAVQVDGLPEGNLPDYLYQDGEFMYDPRPKQETAEAVPTTDDVLNTLLGVSK